MEFEGMEQVSYLLPVTESPWRDEVSNGGSAEVQQPQAYPPPITLCVLWTTYRHAPPTMPTQTANVVVAESSAPRLEHAARALSVEDMPAGI